MSVGKESTGKEAQSHTKHKASLTNKRCKTVKEESQNDSSEDVQNTEINSFSRKVKAN